jgi:putative transposase
VSAIEVDRSLPGARIVRVLDRLARTRGLPSEIVCDYGPAFRGEVVDQWAYERGVALQFDPGKPIQNADAESFNGRLRDECSNESWFVSLADARHTIEAWRIDYSGTRPHSGLAGRTPEEFAKVVRTNTSSLNPTLH